MPLEEVGHRPGTALLGEVSGRNEAVVDRPARTPEGIPVPLEAIVCGTHVRWTADGRDIAAAELDQVLGREHPAAAVVVVDVADARAGRRPTSDDDRDAPPSKFFRERVVAVERVHDHAVDVAGHQVGLELALLVVALRQEEDELLAASRQRRADPSEHLGKERVTEHPRSRLGDQDADRVAPAGDQASGGDVRDESQAVDRPLDQAFRRRVHPRIAVDDARDGRLRNAGRLGHLVHRHAAVVAVLFARHALRGSLCSLPP